MRESQGGTEHIQLHVREIGPNTGCEHAVQLVQRRASIAANLSTPNRERSEQYATH